MDAKLRVVDGAKPALIRLKLPTVIGRSRDATLKIKSSQISRQHCEIDQFEGELTVQDLESSNGTYVNGQRISETTYLSPGDELRIGPLTFRAEYELQQPPVDATKYEPNPPAASTESLPDRHNDVVQDESAEQPPAGISSIVRYEESDDGSFLGIEEIAEPKTPTEQPADVSSTIATERTQSDQTVDPKVDLDVGELNVGKPSKSIDPDDSQLNKFFEGLS